MNINCFSQWKSLQFLIGLNSSCNWGKKLISRTAFGCVLVPLCNLCVQRTIFSRLSFQSKLQVTWRSCQFLMQKDWGQQVKLDYVWLQIYLTAQSSQINRSSAAILNAKAERRRGPLEPTSAQSSTLGTVLDTVKAVGPRQSLWFKAAFTLQISVIISAWIHFLEYQDAEVILTLTGISRSFKSVSDRDQNSGYMMDRVQSFDRQWLHWTTEMTMKLKL